MTQRLWRSPPKRPYRPRDKAVTSAMMTAVRARDNEAEMRLRRELWRRGFRYRLYSSRLKGRPDLTFPRFRMVVFIDGDFWHGRGLIENGLKAFERTLRTRRRKWWVQKIARNIQRDREVTAKLADMGWRVVRLWESDVLRNLRRAADKVQTVSRRR